MSAAMMGTIVILVLTLLVMGGITYGVLRAKRAVEDFSQEAFGTRDIREGFRQVEEEYSATPKSVSAMTSMYLPRIKKDFPEFHYDEMKVRAENALTSYLRALDEQQARLLKEGNQELKDKLEMRIEMQKGAGHRAHYDNIHIHRTEIADYKKRSGRCTVTFQTSLQYDYTLTDENGKVLEGNAKLPTQSRYNIDEIYIQDRSMIENEWDHSIGLNCPNCGAPLSGTGKRVCEYCGTPVVEFNIYTWTFSDITELK